MFAIIGVRNKPKAYNLLLHLTLSQCGSLKEEKNVLGIGRCFKILNNSLTSITLLYILVEKLILLGLNAFFTMVLMLRQENLNVITGFCLTFFTIAKKSCH